MAKTSSSSTRSWRRGKLALLLIVCLSCVSRTVVRLTSRTRDNPDSDFFKCPNHQRDGSGCSFWLWEEQYGKFLCEWGMISSDEYNMAVMKTETKVEELLVREGMEKLSVLVRMLMAVLEVGKEVVFLLKGLLVVCVLLLVTWVSLQLLKMSMYGRC